MLTKYGLTSLDELMARLNIDDLVAKAESGDGQGKEKNDSTHTEAKATNDSRNGQRATQASPSSGASSNSPGGSSRDGDEADDEGEGSQERHSRSSTDGSRSGRADGERTFVSYVSTHPDGGEEGPDPDGLTQAERMALEARAIDFIRSREPLLKTMPTGNKGFDLIETDANDEPERWIEVKAMKGSLENRPVGLSSVQFEFARQHGEQYWLYVVEHAGDPDRTRIVKINNPAGRAGTFTFDKGWTAIAVIDAGLEKAS